MQSSKPNLVTRDDTLLGVCEALGEDFGFNPLWLRIALGGLFIWNPVAVIGGYLVAGAIVLLSRKLSPNPRQAALPSASPAMVQPAAQPVRPSADNEAQMPAIAA